MRPPLSILVRLQNEPPPSSRKASASGTGDGGFALVAVIVIATLIATLAIALGVLVRGIATDSAKLIADAEMRAATEAGLNRVLLAYLRKGDPLRVALSPDGRSVIWGFNGKTLTLRAQAESGKVDLNAGDREHIAALVGRIVDDPRAPTEIVARIDRARAARERIRSPAAILAPIDRMTTTRDVFDALFTVMTDQRGIDPVTAPALVLETMPGLPDETRQRILAARAAAQPLPSDMVGGRFASQRPVYTLRAEATTGFGRAGAAQAVVSFDEQGRVTIHAWARAGLRP